MQLNATFDKLMNDKELEKKMTTEQLALLLKSGQNDSQASRDGGEKKKESKYKPRLKLKNVCQNCSKKEHWSGMLKYLKYKDKREQSRKSESTNFAIDNLHLIGEKDLGERKIRRILIAKKNTSGKKLLLDCSAIAYMFDKQHYFISYIPAQTTGQYITISSHNCIPITDHGSVKFQTKLPVEILTIVLHNVIYFQSQSKPCQPWSVVQRRCKHSEYQIKVSYRGWR